MPQAFSHRWDVLQVSSLSQTEDDLQEVPVHQSCTVHTFCYFQSLTKSGKTNKEDEQNRTIKSQVSTLSFYIRYIYVVDARGLHCMLDNY